MKHCTQHKYFVMDCAACHSMYPTNQPLAGEGQVTINTPMSNIRHEHPSKVKHHSDRFKAMSFKIAWAIGTAKESLYGTGK